MNKKFENFIDELFDLKLEEYQTKEEIVKYLTVIENFYTDKIHKNRSDFEKKLKRINKQQAQSGKVSMFVERTELEQVFTDSMQEVRKQILKRRIKNEVIYNNKQRPIHKAEETD